MYKRINQLLSIKIHSLCLRQKIFLVFLLTIFLLTGASALGITLVAQSNNNLLYRTTADSLSNTSFAVQNSLTSIQSLSMSIASDATIQRTLSQLKDSPDAWNASLSNNLYNSIERYFQQTTKKEVSYIMITTGNFSSSTYIQDSLQLPENIQDELILSASGHYGKSVWVTKYSSQYGLFLVKEIRRIANAKFDSLGTIIIRIDINSVINNCMHSTTRYSGGIYLLCENGSIIGQSRLLTNNDSLNILQNFHGPYQKIRIQSNNYFIVKNSLSDFSWDFYILIPYDNIYHIISIAQVGFFLMITVAVVLSLKFSERFISSLTMHFDRLVKKIKTFQKVQQEGGRLVKIENEYDYTNRNDEIGLIHQAFDQMAKNIDQLIQVNYKSKLLIKEAQLKSLETQINPHFLYNTLESINWRAKSAGQTEISMMTESLGILLRTSLSQKTATISIRDELRFLNSYITIQKLRYDEQLSFSLYADESVMNIQIPRLIIQPLVENAINYGLEQTTAVCQILVFLTHDKHNIYIQVKNSDSQFEDNLLDKLKKGQIKANGCGIGLLNIEQRIKLGFGDAYGLKLFNDKNFAVAQLTLPLQ